MTTTAARTRTRELLGVLAVVGAAAAVAGTGTFGAFTDSTAPLAATVSSGVVSIDLADAGGSAYPVDVAGFVPGDRMTRVVDLRNDGSAPMASISLSAVPLTSSVLDTDTTDGLQLTVRSCDVAWSMTLVGGAPVHSCAGAERTLAAGPVAGSRALSAPASLAVGGVDHLAVSVALPQTAGDAFQGARSRMAVTSTGTQATSTAR
ncbi:TasA family protein [Modestobacter sp. SSW1-42]|uniref:TasA family protein n=1 Tax=Modestobacter sp. SSW1-42 TaxID=596372 RepID=UPI003987A0C0